LAWKASETWETRGKEMPRVLVVSYHGAYLETISGQLAGVFLSVKKTTTTDDRSKKGVSVQIVRVRESFSKK
jgi:hypothetical protein